MFCPRRREVVRGRPLPIEPPLLARERARQRVAGDARLDHAASLSPAEPELLLTHFTTSPLQKFIC
jgi:hypothetical protein